MSVMACIVDVDVGGMPENGTPDSVLSISLLSLFEASFASGEVVCFWVATLVAEGAPLG